MRCVCCDVELSEGEIALDRELKSVPCTTCQQIIYETAYGKSLPTYEEVDDYADGGIDEDDEIFAEFVEDDLSSV